MNRILTVLLIMVFSPYVCANHMFLSCPVHTWHKISSRSGEWRVTLRMINEKGLLVDESCQAVNQVQLSTAKPLMYGFGFEQDATFDIAYTVTAVETTSSSGFESKACVFVVTANGPAQPDIHALGYHGAQCQWSIVPGIGEDFIVS